MRSHRLQLVATPAEVRRTVKVLVVDDNRDAASSLRALLDLAGHQVREAYGGEEALRHAFEFEPDVVLLDIVAAFDAERPTRA